MRHSTLISSRTAIVIAVAFLGAAIGVLAGLTSGTGWRAYTVHGVSMEPQYEQGDLIITSSLDGRTVEPGSIIVFTADWASERHGNRVVHRVTAVGSVDGSPFAYTRGDANSVADPGLVDLTSDDVQIVRFSVADGALWLERGTTPMALALAVAAIGAIVAGMTVFLGIPLVRGIPLVGARRRVQPEKAFVEANSPEPEASLLG